MAKHSKHKHGKHAHEQEKQHGAGKKEEPKPKAAPEAAQNPANTAVSSALFRWSNPIPDPQGGSFCWQSRLTPTGNWEWQVMGSETIKPRQVPQMGMQPYVAKPGPLTAHPYAANGQYTTSVSPMQTMTAGAQYPYQAQNPYQMQQPYQAQTVAGLTGASATLAGQVAPPSNNKTVAFEPPAQEEKAAKRSDSKGRGHSHKHRSESKDHGRSGERRSGRHHHSDRRRQMSSGEKVSQWLSKPSYRDDDDDDYDYDYDDDWNGTYGG